jgi:hypothetical protein
MLTVGPVKRQVNHPSASRKRIDDRGIVEPELMIRRLVGAHELPPARLRQMDALVEVWLPGSGGRGRGRSAVGRASNTGRLPVTWPRTLAQQPISVGDRDYDPLCPCGFGLWTK